MKTLLFGNEEDIEQFECGENETERVEKREGEKESLIHHFQIPNKWE